MVAFMLLGGCSPRLAQVYQKDFQIGTALGSVDVNHDYIYPMRKDLKELAVLEREFSCVTPENLMKWEYVHPQSGFYNFEQADEFVEYVEAHGLDIVGHVLIWHSQTPSWVFEDEAGNPVSRDVLIERMRDHIHTVVGRYKGRIKYWDVVNEAVDTRQEDGKRVAFYRNTPWFRIIGPEFIELAFRFAHEADSEAQLLYNDFSMTDLEKTAFVAQMVRGLKAKNVPIYGVGMQGHWHLEYPERDELQTAIQMLADSGVSVSITELDLGVLPRPENHRGANISDRAAYQAALNPYAEGLPLDVEQEQIQKLRMIFEVLQSNREHIDRVTFWGVSDLYSWKNDFPVSSRTDYPLLFDRDMRPKALYDALVR